MASYGKYEAREWAREHLRGVANVVIPSFSANLDGLCEPGIRHDIRTDIEFGFSGALLVSEVAISLSEYRQFFEWANDESRGRLKLIHHASWNNFDENIAAVRAAESNGAELVLLSYPPNFYAESAQDIYEYTRAFCDSTELGVMIFPMSLWGFDRVHSSHIAADVIRRLIDDCQNLVAIKAEGGHPGIMGFVECYRLFGKEVVVTNPLEADMIPLATLVPIQFSGTSNTEYFGAAVPRIFDLIQAGDYAAATELYWRIHPARKANAAASAYMAQTHFINRMLWKYQGWLNGFNGGPLRQPTMRVHDAEMNMLRRALVESGLKPTQSHNREFFVGRYPVETADVTVRRVA
jgi:4-hydroxy-tetrahydrodipicolinate synthase